MFYILYLQRTNSTTKKLSQALFKAVAIAVTTSHSTRHASLTSSQAPLTLQSPVSIYSDLARSLLVT